MWQGWFNLAVAVWLIVCSFVPSLHTPVAMLIGGVVAVIFGLWAAVDKRWQGYPNALIGVWLFLSAVAFNILAPWNFFVFGIAIGIFAIWNLATPRHMPHQPKTV